ncbi:uncharacterized protein N7496_004427 [Penicillium cataractarum]|uniref:F-box domain-containing protein n=1 Tax=Penicillium cataractarum TaxID=2100454 RepID=A0A9W9VIH2_9EURO|nr:uncharacterized protein N7496_004427 [Penicillium cataractarum]KAJ5381999.1 hypothetical protein N7496_004427 [Penicillium cataractarum]
MTSSLLTSPCGSLPPQNHKITLLWHFRFARLSFIRLLPTTSTFVMKRFGDSGPRFKLCDSWLFVYSPEPSPPTVTEHAAYLADKVGDINLNDWSTSEVSAKLPAERQPEISAPTLPKEPDTEPMVHIQPANQSKGTDLEKLPPELRLRLLSGLDFKSLKALVHASPVYHEQYAMNRKTLLFQSFMNMLGGAALDAQMAYHSGTHDYLRARNKDSVAQFLRTYLKYRSSTTWTSPHGMSADGTAPDNLRPIDTFTLDEILPMITFHKTVVKPLLGHFAHWALENLAQTPGARRCFELLTQTEKARIYRALYRYQICANLFGYRPGIDGKGFDAPRPDFDGVYILASLEAMYEPWEIEELTCITLFFECSCKDIFERVGFGFDDSESDTEESLDEEDVVVYTAGFLSQGLELLHSLVGTTEIPDLLAIVKDNLVYRLDGYFLGTTSLDAFGLDTLDYRHVRGHDERDFKQHRRDPLPFKGDQTMDPKGVYPPLAWTLLWLETYNNRVGILIERNIQLWGYVFWDSSRMQYMNARKVIETQWPRLHWDQDDPRRHLDSEGRVIPGNDDDLHSRGIFPVTHPQAGFLA